jgi:uncharacterized protein (UPF0128 family)
LINTVYLSAVFNKDKLNRLREIAKKLGITTNKAINQAVEMFIKKHDKEGK